MKNTLRYVLFILISVAVVLVAIAVTIGGFIAIDLLLESTILPKDYLFFENTPLCSNMLAIIVAVPVCIGVCTVIPLIKGKLLPKSEDPEDPAWFAILKKLGKWNILIALVWLFIGYCCFTSFTYVTPERIVKVSPFNLSGEEYGYSDVERIETGFGKKKHSLTEYDKKGSFYYKIYLDGEMTVFTAPTTNSDIERYEDTYLELEELDLALTALDIPKKASTAGYENCKLDSCYVERFLRIINNN
ncbi:MAG: hypothetical protein E7647_00870 [Ruminococcaceae bacterium]|nr:hypothetical protein [Oscillospiraceae bacterium]